MMLRSEWREMKGKKVYKIEKLADTIIVREEADIDKIAERIADKLEAVPA